jgi:hypothetical protein
MNKKMLLGLSTLILVLLFCCDWLLAAKDNGSVLVALLLWSAVAQGVIALVAAADLSAGKWMKPLRSHLLQFHHLLLLFPFVFIIFCRHVPLYNWWLHPPNPWLQQTFLSSEMCCSFSSLI